MPQVASCERAIDPEQPIITSGNVSVEDQFSRMKKPQLREVVDCHVVPVRKE